MFLLFHQSDLSQKLLLAKFPLLLTSEGWVLCPFPNQSLGGWGKRGGIKTVGLEKILFNTIFLIKILLQV